MSKSRLVPKCRYRSIDPISGGSHTYMFHKKEAGRQFPRAGECWRWLLRPNRLLKASEFSSPGSCSDCEKMAQDIETYTGWQPSFLKIHGLTLKLLLCGSYHECGHSRIDQETDKICSLNTEVLSRLDECLRESKLIFKARRVQVRLVMQNGVNRIAHDKHSGLLDDLVRRVQDQAE
jgi:hypothetical protein